jgi:hypothetical protein
MHQPDLLRGLIVGGFGGFCVVGSFARNAIGRWYHRIFLFAVGAVWFAGGVALLVGYRP